MKYVNFFSRWIFILCLPPMLLSAGIAWAANSLWIYEAGFHKYDISTVTGLDNTQLEKAARGIISYWNSGEEYIDITVEKDGRSFTLFNEREVIHLKDVKGLFRLDYGVLLVTFIYSLGYVLFHLFRSRSAAWLRLARAARTGSIITLVVMAALGLGSLFGFDRLFWQFHLLVFSNDFWQLDPARDYLIMLFPGGFWYDVTIDCALATAGLAAVIGGGSWWYLRTKTRA